MVLASLLYASVLAVCGVYSAGVRPGQIKHLVTFGDSYTDVVLTGGFTRIVTCLVLRVLQAMQPPPGLVGQMSFRKYSKATEKTSSSLRRGLRPRRTPPLCARGCNLLQQPYFPAIPPAL
jgi:hypothetical protein